MSGNPTVLVFRTDTVVNVAVDSEQWDGFLELLLWARDARYLAIDFAFP